MTGRVKSSRTLEYMLRLEPEDFRDAAWVEKLAEAANLRSDRLRARFERPIA